MGASRLIKKFAVYALVSAIITFTITYTIFDLYYISKLEDELSDVQSQVKAFENETKAIKKDMEPEIERCLSNSELKLDELIWPINDPNKNYVFKSKTKQLEISVPPKSKIFAAADGTVLTVTPSDTNITLDDQIVLIRHSKNLLSVYAGSNKIIVNDGQNINKGELIGSNNSNTSNILYFELRHCYRKINPLNFFKEL